MKITFWGVRGSIPSPGEDKIYFGGNTSCVEVQLKNHIFILDCGTGLRGLGNKLLQGGGNITAKIFLSHYHWDHIQGFPFFIPFYVPNNAFEIYGPTLGGKNVKSLLEGQMQAPYFPVPLSALQSNLSFHDVEEGNCYSFDDLNVSVLPINHPGGAFAYKFSSHDATLIYATDTEHYEGRIDESLVDFCKGADVLIYDAQFSPEEYHGQNGGASKKGWGHSTMFHGAEIALKSKIKKLVLFHHDPNKGDKAIFEFEKRARKIFPETVASFDGMTITKIEGEKIEVSQKAFQHQQEKTPDKSNREAEEYKKMLIKQEKLASLGTMVAGLAHELNQPVTNINLLCQVVKEKSKKNKLNQEEVLEKSNTITKQCNRMIKLIERLKNYASSGSSEPENKKVDISQVIKETLKLMENQLKKEEVSVLIRLDNNLPNILGDFYQLEQVFINIINNARDAMKENKDKKKELKIRAKKNNNNVLVSIADTGYGISQKEKEGIFKPFFTTKPVGKGTGLGMYVTQEIVTSHKATITVNKTQDGTMFSLSFPEM
ncbi:MAG: GHKL domain-containing protein [Nitrospinae bacterium]|nr:GHKL domain-containing protein [Nitrospinota bacterium]